MAQSTLHFGIGMLCATAFTIKPVLQAWLASKGGRQSSAAVDDLSAPTISNAMARWCLWSYAAGILAVMPAMARRLTGIEPTHPIWNLFVVYPLIDRLPLPSIILGELLMSIILAAQYAIILCAIHHANTSTRQPAQSSQ